MSSHPVVRWQIVSPQPDALRDFYCRLFGWTSTRDNLLQAEQIDTGSERGITGGIWPAPPQAPSFVQLFVEVDDCEAMVTQATALGASVLMPPQTLPDGDTMAVLRDPTGMSFCLMRPAPL